MSRDNTALPHLLPCPFCGGTADAVFGEHHFQDVKIRCNGCDAEGPLFDAENGSREANLTAAAEHWNARALPALPSEAEQAYGYLSRLFKEVAPQCEPLPNLLGVCTQIDNYIAGLRALPAQPDRGGELARIWTQIEDAEFENIDDDDDLVVITITAPQARAIRAALRSPASEAKPVAWRVRHKADDTSALFDGSELPAFVASNKYGYETQPLYAAPQPASVTEEVMSRIHVSATGKTITVVCDDHDAKDAVFDLLTGEK